MHNVINHYKAARAELEAPGSPFETTTIEVRGVPVRVFKSAPPNMRVLWEATAAHGDKEYVVYEDEHYSYAQIHEQVRKLAATFVAQGVVPGDRIALSMRNYPEWVVGYWATLSLGAACAGMRPASGIRCARFSARRTRAGLSVSAFPSWKASTASFSSRLCTISRSSSST